MADHFRSSTPLKPSATFVNSSTPRRTSRDDTTTSGDHQLRELEQKISQLNLDIELLVYEKNELEQENNLLKHENNVLKQTIKEKDQIHMRLREQTQSVIDVAHNLYNRLRTFKCKYYQEKVNGCWMNGDER